MHVGGAPGAQVQRGAGAFGYDVDARAAFDNVGVDADAAARVVPFFDAGDLRGELVNGVDAFFGGEACVGRAAVDGQLCFTHALARSFEQAARSESGFEDED